MSSRTCKVTVSVSVSVSDTDVNASTTDRHIQSQITHITCSDVATLLFIVWSISWIYRQPLSCKVLSLRSHWTQQSLFHQKRLVAKVPDGCCGDHSWHCTYKHIQPGNYLLEQLLPATLVLLMASSAHPKDTKLAWSVVLSRGEVRISYAEQAGTLASILYCSILLVAVVPHTYLKVEWQLQTLEESVEMLCVPSLTAEDAGAFRSGAWWAQQAFLYASKQLSLI